jgi:hypothetical protein
MEDKLENEQETDWRTELYKTFATLILNLVVVIILILGVVYTDADISSRFMSLLELVIGAIFGITATQIAKE